MQDQNLSPDQVLQLTQAMLSVAAVDGLQDAELALIRDFYAASRSGDMPPDEAVGPGFSAPPLAAATPEFAETAVLMCLMAAYADGKMSTGEWSKVGEIATAVGVGAERLAALAAEVRDELSAALASLPDAASVAKVVAELERIG